MAVRRSRRELPSPNPKHDPYVAVSSCGQADCEHLDYAIRHLEHIQRLSENSGRSELIREVSQRALIAEQERAESEDSLAKLNRAADRLSTELEASEREGRQVTSLRDKLTQEEGRFSG